MIFSTNTELNISILKNIQSKHLYTMFNFIFIIFVRLFSATSAESNCFKLINDNISLIGNILTIKGNGTMCDCHFDELEHYRKTVQKIHFEQSVTTIGKKCFEQFTSLTSIEFGKGITQIKEGAFYDTKISQITIPKNIQKIEQLAFAGNDELTQIIFEESTDGTDEEIIIQKYAFQDCSKLQKFHIPKRLKQFDSKMFDNCNNLKELSIETNHEKYQVKDNVLFDKEMTKLLFYPKGLQNDLYSIPKGVQVIEKEVFSSTSSQWIKFPSSLKQIGKRSFYSSQQIKVVYLPESIQIIEDHAFALNEKLETVIITSETITIKKKSFYGCKNLKNVIIQSKTITMETDSFEQCNNLELIQVSKEFEGTNSQGTIKQKQVEIGSCGDECVYTMDDSKLSFYGSGTLLSIDEKIQQQKDKISEIFISSSITLIGNNLFDSFTQLSTVNYDGVIQPLCSKSLFKQTAVEFVDVPIEYCLFCGAVPRTKGSCGENCTFIFNHKEKSLEIIGDKMQDYSSMKNVPWYSQIENIKSVSFKGITHIGNNSFSGATSLIKVDLSESKLESIGKNAFANCGELTFIKLPSTLDEIGENAFNGCDKLKTIRYEGKSNPCDDNVTIIKNVGTIKTYVHINYDDTDFCGLEMIPSDECGDTCYWRINKDTNELIIEGFGKMNDYSSNKNVPWFSKRSEIKSVVITSVESI